MCSMARCYGVLLLVISISFVLLLSCYYHPPPASISIATTSSWVNFRHHHPSLFPGMQEEYGSSFEAPEPFDSIHGACFDCAPEQPWSPDPLVRMTWSSSKANFNASELQIYRVHRPVDFTVSVPGAIHGLTEWLEGRSSSLSVSKSCTLVLDWGVERAAWLEFLSVNLVDVNMIEAAISEFNSPYPTKTHVPIQYGNATFRLETNDELYEGVRFTFLMFTLSANQIEPLVVSNVSLVAKVKPVNYTGSYHSLLSPSSSDTAGNHDDRNMNILTSIWYTGAYGVRLNMEATQFNSILIERGDRVAIQGDGHPTMAAALVAFGSNDTYHMVHTMLNQTNSGHVHGHRVVDDHIMAYPIYWTLSVMDWYWATGHNESFRRLVPDIMSIIDERIDDFLQLDLDIVWMGWDDRLGNGWCYHANNDTCPYEAHYTLAALVTRACRDLGDSLEALGMLDKAEHYQSLHQELINRFRVEVSIRNLGVHSASNVLNAGIAVDSSEIQYLLDTYLNDPVTICSWSPFNQYWILQALGNAGEMDKALASIQLCWGPMLKLGKGCFWELSEPDWPSFLNEGDKAPTTPSYCHPWSSGVTAWLTHVHAGIHPILPGYDDVLISPYVSAGYPSVDASVSTLWGAIEVNATLDLAGHLQIDVDTPVSSLIGIDTYLTDLLLEDMSHCDATVVSWSLNGQVLPIKRSSGIFYETAVQHLGPMRTKKMLFVKIAKPGQHRVTAHYQRICPAATTPSVVSQARSLTANRNDSGLQRIQPFPEPSYPATTTLDRTSQGDGLYNYGKDGYVLLGYNQNGSNAQQLPSYVEKLKIIKHGWKGWTNVPSNYMGSDPNNSAFLPDPTTRSSHWRALGRIGYDESTNWDEGFLIDVTFDEALRESFKLAIYAVATDAHEKYAVRIMDLGTLDPIAPTMLVDDYSGGVWFTISYSKSVRLRVMGIYGTHLSAIAFSTDKATTKEE